MINLADFKETMKKSGIGMPFRKTEIWNGVSIEVYSVGWVSLLGGASNSTLRAWERLGIMPKPIFNNGVFRYYTAYEVRGFSSVIRAHFKACRHMVGFDRSTRLTAQVRPSLQKVSDSARAAYESLSASNFQRNKELLAVNISAEAPAVSRKMVMQSKSKTVLRKLVQEKADKKGAYAKGFRPRTYDDAEAQE